MRVHELIKRLNELKKNNIDIVNQEKIIEHDELLHEKK